jgi:hypothetical protein
LDNIFVRVEPVEYDGKRKRIVRYYKKGKRFIDVELTASKFKAILEGLNLEKEPSIIENPKGLIIYQYPDKPLIAINLEDGNFYTTTETIKHFGWKLVRHQASILLRILKEYGYANPFLKRKSISLRKWCFEKKGR